jgi:hypothetical protein
MVGIYHGESCSSLGGWDTKRKREEEELGPNSASKTHPQCVLDFLLLDPIFSRFHHLQITLWAEDEDFNTWPLGDIQDPNACLSNYLAN